MVVPAGHFPPVAAENIHFTPGNLVLPTSNRIASSGTFGRLGLSEAAFGLDYCSSESFWATSSNSRSHFDLPLGTVSSEDGSYEEEEGQDGGVDRHGRGGGGSDGDVECHSSGWELVL